jgi:integrase
MRGRGSVYKRCGCVNAEDGRKLGRRCPLLARRGHGCWYFNVELPSARDGSRRRLRRGGYRSRAAADAARGYWLGEDANPDLSLVTVGQWLDVWLETRHSLRPNTRRIYTQLIRDYLKPRLGGIPLRELTIGTAQAMFTALLRGSSLSPASLQRIREVLRAALNGAIRRGLITTNPARWVELPSNRRPRAVVWTAPRVALWQATGERPAVAVWTVGQTAAFLDQAREHPMFPLFWLAALLGLRRGEVVGLRWCDIDLNERVLTVSHQIQEHDGHAVLVPPKSDRSLRTIALDHVTVTMLHRLQQRGISASGFLCVNRHGRPWSPSYVSHTFGKLVAKTQLPPVRFHDLRHGAASLSLAAGNDLKVVQALLDHDSIVLTADTYTSVVPCLAHRAAEAIITLVLKASRDRARRLRGRNRRQRRTDTVPRMIVDDLRKDGHTGTHLGPTEDQHQPARSPRSRKPAGRSRPKEGAPPGTRTPNPLVKSTGPCQIVPANVAWCRSSRARLGRVRAGICRIVQATHAAIRLPG